MPVVPTIQGTANRLPGSLRASCAMIAGSRLR